MKLQNMTIYINKCILKVKKAIREFTDEKKSLTQTGDGPPLPEMSVTSQGIVDMMSGLASFSGIPGASNCKSCISAPTSTSVPVEDSHVQIILWEGTPSTTVTAVHKGGLPQTPVVKIADEAPAQENCNAGYGSEVDAPAPEPERKKFRPGNISKETPTTLKELQMRYYRKCIEVQEAQLECWTKCSRLAEVMLQKMP
ncbi:uncharacterized protein LOC127880236 [Dreissena polymorpha]|uniref:uncharacterized protein LOC127880236 n=1 Tax=Dreissena polymorpha TaxID=45954 RepID=UPI002264C55A|nr:uncharacterized protein LOC127880236 [Dreissena polymorpha]